MMTEDEIKIQAEIGSLWKILDADQIKKLTQAKSQISVSGRFVGVAVDVNRSRHVLIPCPSGDDAAGLWKSAAVILDRRNLTAADGMPGTWLVLSCLRHELDDVFVRLAANVIHNLPTDPLRILPSCIATLDDWRELLGALRRPALGPEEVVGLIGELLVLEKLARIDPALAVAAWEGPSGGRHDFRYGLHAIEAKATTKRVGRFIVINGPRQLETPQGGTLHLSWARLEVTPGGTVDLAGLVSRIREAGVDKDSLLGPLGKRGYDEAAKDPVVLTKYELAEWLVWRVDSDFPRIVPASFAGGVVPNSVINLNYTIDLSGPEPAPLAATDHENIWSGLLGHQAH